jgi:hypothetical protein
MVKPWLNQRNFTGKHVYTRLHPGFPVMFPEITPSHAQGHRQIQWFVIVPPMKKMPFSDSA